MGLYCVSSFPHCGDGLASSDNRAVKNPSEINTISLLGHASYVAESKNAAGPSYLLEKSPFLGKPGLAYGVESFTVVYLSLRNLLASTDLTSLT